MSNILLIDDLRDFRTVLPGQYVTIARTSAAALTILEDKDTWDEIWLDHDLGELADGTVDDIMVIVDYLSERAFNDNPVNTPIIYVHSSNPVGVRQMVASLTRYGYNVRQQSPETVFIVHA
jgi:hypothetical protein